MSTIGTLERKALEKFGMTVSKDGNEATFTGKIEQPKGIPAMQRVKSSSIAEIGHDGSAMFIRYAAGNLYRFPGITTDQFKAARDAKSIGSHVNSFIIPKVKGIPVREQE